MKNRIAFIGGDRRMLVAAECFENAGYSVSLFGFELTTPPHEASASPEDALAGCDIVVLPLPWTKDGAHIWMPLSTQTLPISCIIALTAGKKVLGGMLDGAPEGWCDYFKSEALQLRNAVPTAEGAISIAMEQLPITISGCRAVITGFGRVAFALAARLVSLQAKVTVAARSERDRAAAECIGCETVSIARIERALSTADVIFNTIPARLFPNGLPNVCRAGTLLIELAPTPGCVSAVTAADAGIRHVSAGGLPGKVFPVSAGRIIFGSLIGIIESEDNT